MSYSKIKKTHGLVLSEANSGDYDKVITILTSNMGKITAFAKGARRPKSALLAPTQVFSFASFVLYEGRNMFYINSAEIVDVFYDIRFDYQKMEIGFKILKILRAVSPENYEVYNYLKLGVLTLSYLSKTDKSPEFVFYIFVARLLYELGFALDLKESKKKNEETEKNIKTDEEKFAIYSDNSGILTEYRNESTEKKNKAKLNARNINEKDDETLIKRYLININVFSSIKYIYNSKLEEIFNFNLEKEAEKEFISLISKGLKRHINIKL